MIDIENLLYDKIKQKFLNGMKMAFMLFRSLLILMKHIHIRIIKMFRLLLLVIIQRTIVGVSVYLTRKDGTMLFGGKMKRVLLTLMTPTNAQKPCINGMGNKV